MTADALEDTVSDIAEQLPRKKLSGKKLVLLVILPLLVIGGAVGGLFATGMLDSLLGGEAEEHGEPMAEEEAHPPEGPVDPNSLVYYDLPDILVNLNTPDRRPSFLSISVSLELMSEEDVASVEHVMPRIIDNFQIYLRELQNDDLRGSAGLYRLREELLRRVNGAVGEVHVRDVLFREMLVQ